MKNKKGISLVVLIITIIIMLILAGATMITLMGDNGIITKAQEVAFREEMLSIRDAVDIYNIRSEVGASTQINLVQLSEADIAASNIKDTLKIEILYWGNYEIDVNVIRPAYVKSGDNFKRLVTDNNGNIKSLYYLVGEEKINRKYIYNKETDTIYKVDVTRIGMHKVHSIDELDYQKNGGTREKVRETKNYTKISYTPQVVTVSNLSYYEPDLNNMTRETTSLIFYKIEIEDGNEIVTDTTKEISANEWLADGRKSKITVEDATYVLYDYQKQIWANIKVVANDVETWWAWIPRYAYNISKSTKATNVIFVDTNNNPIDGSELPSGYKEAGSFEDNQKKGLWMSKYEPTAIVQTDTAYYEYYIPDLSEFNKENVYIQVYNKATNTFDEQVKASTISNLSQFANKKLWFDYENKIWANIKVVANDIETWWVWIPRYAYNISSTTKETDIIFVDINNNPIDGSKLPSGYKVAGSFEDNQKKGLWMSKYEPTPIEK